MGVVAVLLIGGLVWSIVKLVKLMKKERVDRKNMTPEERANTKTHMQNLSDFANNKNINGEICCPRCHSTNITMVKKGFGIGKAVTGFALTGGIGILAGGIGSKKMHRVCVNCKKKF